MAIKSPANARLNPGICNDWLLSQRSPLPRAKCSISSISNE
ncbi:hypothetical protein HMPREF1606_01044, partial [Escherichia coli 908522]